MPLPLPNLDTRTWADLVEEARALIPRYAPAWTDHNVHDPGITVIELLAWLVEQQVYRVNRVPAAHRRKFLALAGVFPAPPRPACVALSFPVVDGTEHDLPAGVVVATGDDEHPIGFSTRRSVRLVPASIVAVQVFDGDRVADLTRDFHAGQAIRPWGENPSANAALYLGFDHVLPVGHTVGLWLSIARWRVEGPVAAERARLAAEHGGMPPHHSVRARWEYREAAGWRALAPNTGEVADDTRGLTLDGAVRITLPTAMAQTVEGADPTARFWLRCVLDSGRPDTAPVLRGAALNVVEAEQVIPMRTSFRVARGVPPAGQEPVVGMWTRLRLTLKGTQVESSVEVAPDLDVPEVLVLGYTPSTNTVEGTLAVTLAALGEGSGLPQQMVQLPGVAVAHGDLELWTLKSDHAQRWHARADLDRSGPHDAHFTVDPASGEIGFGDGEHGRVVPAGTSIFARYDVTAGRAGNVPETARWRLAGADDLLNAIVLGDDPKTFAAALGRIVAVGPAEGGADLETLEHAAGRAAEALWAHERLVEFCSPGTAQTLDQRGWRQVLSRAAPSRAMTLLDFERLALGVPGTRVARVRAWAGIDPAYPCVQAPGTVTVVVVPELPERRPEPTDGLLRAVRCFLDRRRVLGTRLVVAGPRYLEVSVRATVRAQAGSRLERVRVAVLEAVDAFLDPLAGGPEGQGWPFGRDVFRSEILAVIDGVAGIDHVMRLELVGGAGPAQCGNLCVTPTWLAAPGTHAIEVV
jgi:predicted phage baseplate assembly protein